MKILLTLTALFLALSAHADVCTWNDVAPNAPAPGTAKDVQWETPFAIGAGRSIEIRSVRVGIDSYDEYVEVVQSGKLMTCKESYLFATDRNGNSVYNGMQSVCGTFTVQCRFR